MSSPVPGDSDDVQTLSETSIDSGMENVQISEEMDMETDEIIIDTQAQEEEEEEEELQNEEEEIVHSEAEIEPQEVEIKTEHGMNSLEAKVKSALSIPPLRPLNIAPKPEQVPIAVKSVGGQSLILMPGGSGAQTIKLLNPQGQELNLANFSLSRPLAVKQPEKPITTTPIMQTQPKQIVMKKIIGQKTMTKPGQQFVVVQKPATAAASTANPQTRTISLQQAQELGLLGGSTKIVQPAKRTVLINKTPPRTIKLMPHTMAQLKTSPAKILPAASGSVATKVPQKIIFKPSGAEQMLPAGQIIQMATPSGLGNGQIHQINIPGKGMQFIRFVSTSTAQPSNSIVSTTAAVPEAKTIITNKVVTKPATVTKPAQLMLVPAGYLQPSVQVSKVAIPPIKQSSQQHKHGTPVTPRPLQPAVATSPEDASSSPPVTPESAPNTNGIRPRKPCNCTKSQCLKLYCDCFANGEFCYLCNCMNCFNNLENEETRNLAIKACLERNPNAFRPKIGKAKDPAGDATRKHTKGCNCKRSSCLKNYCECYEAKIACSSNCKCFGCRNVDEYPDRKTGGGKVRVIAKKISDEVLTQSIYRAVGIEDMSPGRGRKVVSKKQPISYLTDEVIEATCQCLLTIAENASSNMQDDELTKKQIIEEFGGCLSEIIHCSIGRSVS